MVFLATNKNIADRATYSARNIVNTNENDIGTVSKVIFRTP
jgi:hypothetical protein